MGLTIGWNVLKWIGFLFLFLSLGLLDACLLPSLLPVPFVLLFHFTLLANRTTTNEPRNEQPRNGGGQKAPFLAEPSVPLELARALILIVLLVSGPLLLPYRIAISLRPLSGPSQGSSCFRDDCKLAKDQVNRITRCDWAGHLGCLYSSRVLLFLSLSSVTIAVVSASSSMCSQCQCAINICKHRVALSSLLSPSPGSTTTTTTTNLELEFVMLTHSHIHSPAAALAGDHAKRSSAISRVTFFARPGPGVLGLGQPNGFAAARCGFTFHDSPLLLLNIWII